jgi:acetoin utilization deacetylase AcuC-like enzyme
MIAAVINGAGSAAGSTPPSISSTAAQGGQPFFFLWYTFAVSERTRLPAGGRFGGPLALQDLLYWWCQRSEKPMITVYSDSHLQHDAPHEFIDGRLIPPYESPARAEMILQAVREAALGPIVPPRAFGDAPVRAVHDARYLDYLEHAYERWVAAGGNPAAVLPGTLAVRWMSQRSESPLVAPGYYGFDLSAPIVAGTYAAARAAADTALTGAALLLEGERLAYALCRPPGHHAGTDL